MVVLFCILLMLTCIIMIVLGLVDPKISMFWNKRFQTRLTSTAIYTIVLCMAFIILLDSAFADKKQEQQIKAQQQAYDNGTPLQSTNTPIEPQETAAPQKTHKEMLATAFSSWDGTHRPLVKYVKERLNDPESFENSKTWYREYDNDYIVWMEYRAKNGYGALMLGYIKVRCSYQTGEILEVIETR